MKDTIYIKIDDNTVEAQTTNTEVITLAVSDIIASRQSLVDKIAILQKQLEDDRNQLNAVYSQRTSDVQIQIDEIDIQIQKIKDVGVVIKP